MASATPAQRAPRAPTTLYLRLVAVAFMWGGTFIAGRTLALAMPHFVAASGRYLVACVFLVGYLLVREGRLPQLSRAQFAGVFLLGATGIFLYNAFFFGALARLEASRTALLIATNPALTAVAAYLVFKLRFAWWQWLGVAVAFAGVAIVITRGDLATLGGTAIGAGEALMFCGVLSWVVYTLYGRRMLSAQGALSPLATTTYASLAGLVMLATVAFFQLPDVPWSRVTAAEIGAVAYLGFFGTAVAFVWFYEGVKAIGAARASVFTNLVPIVAVTSAVLILGEPLLASMVIGGLVTLAGVSLTNIERKSPHG